MPPRAIAFGITSSSQVPFRGNTGVSPTEKAPGLGIKENAMVSDARVFTPTAGAGSDPHPPFGKPRNQPGTNRERIGAFLRDGNF